jgi:hypothetical protein
MNRFARIASAVVLISACSDAATSPDGIAPVASPVYAIGGGNSLNAKACQKDGWKSLVTSTGTAFSSQEQCTSYGAKGSNIYKTQSVSLTSANPSPANTGTSYVPTATATSGLPVAITLDPASAGCSLSAGTVAFTSAGTCIVNANQAGNGVYFAAPQVQQSITVVQGCINSEASLRAAALTGGTHTFCAAGTTIVLTGGYVTVSTTLTLTSPAGANSVVNADQKSRVFYVSGSGSLTLANVTVTAGAEATYGGGLRVEGSLTLNGTSTVYGNTAVVGGGVYMAGGGTMTMNDDASVASNLADGMGNQGGGVYLLGSSLVMNNRSSIASNNVRDAIQFAAGGGVLSDGSHVEMNDSSTIKLNHSAIHGGGIYIQAGGSLSLNSSWTSIQDNSAIAGGGIFNSYPVPGSTITGVTATNVTGNTLDNCNGVAVAGCSN